MSQFVAMPAPRFSMLLQDLEGMPFNGCDVASASFCAFLDFRGRSS